MNNSNNNTSLEIFFTFLPPGIGYAMVILSWILVVYYQIVVAHCLYFLCASFTSRLPWTDCDPSWSSPNCMDASRGKCYQ